MSLLLLLPLSLLIWNRPVCQASRPLQDPDGALSVLCAFFSRLEHHQARHPLPSQVLFLTPETSSSPFSTYLNQIRNNQSDCPITNHLSIRNESHLLSSERSALSALRGKLLLIECSGDVPGLGFTSCLTLLDGIMRSNQADGLVARRLTLILLVYETSTSGHNRLSVNLRQALLHPQASHHSKVAGAIISLKWDKKANRIKLNHLSIVRPLKNVCLAEPEQKFLESRKLNVQLLLHRLLARDASGRLIGCDFEETQLTAVVTKSFFCEFTTIEDGQTSLLPSLELNAFRLLSEKYAFKYETVDANGSYGRKDQSGAWLGSIGHLVNQSADLALCDLIYTADRAEVVDFTFPYDMQPVTFLTKLPGYRVRKWAFYYALPPVIWGLAFGTLLLCGAFIKGAIRTRARIKGGDNRDYSIFLLLLCIFLQQSFSHHEFNSLSNLETRLIIIIWSFTSLILMRAYSGVFYSSITVPEAVPPIDTVGEVQRAAATDSAVVFTSRYMFDMAMSAKCCGTFDYDLGQHVRRNPKLIAAVKTSVEQRIDNLQNYKWTNHRPLLFIESKRILLIYRRYLKYAVHLSSATFLLDALGIATQKDALYGPSFSDTIVVMLETGLMDKWLQDTLLEHEHRAFLRRERKKLHSSLAGGESGKKSQAELEAESLHTFGVEELESVFLLYLVGNAIAIGIFLLQLAWRHMNTAPGGGV